MIGGLIAGFMILGLFFSMLSGSPESTRRVPVPAKAEPQEDLKS